VYNGSSAAIINAGTITSYGGCAAQGINPGGFASGSVLNSGAIFVSANGSTSTYFLNGIEVSSDNNFNVTNTGTVTVEGGGAISQGILVDGTSSNITVNNSNLVNVTTTGAEADGAYTDAATSNISFTNSGTIEASGGTTASYGVHTIAGSTGVSVVNSGTISGTNYGIYLGGNNSSVTTTTGGHISGGTDAIALAGTNDSVTVRGQSHISGLIQGDVTTPGTPLSGDVLNLYLAGLTPTQITALKAEIASAGTGTGTYTVGSDTYAWDSFSTVNLSAISTLKPMVDPGLGSIAGRIDNLPSLLSTDFDPFYTDASNNPEAALNSLTGREFINAYRTITVSDDMAFGELTDGRAMDTDGTRWRLCRLVA
jgi:hypothetical protein